MKTNAVQPNFGRRLTAEEANKLIQRNWTMPTGIDSLKISKKNNTAKTDIFTKITNFFKNLLK